MPGAVCAADEREKDGEWDNGEERENEVRAGGSDGVVEWWEEFWICARLTKTMARIVYQIYLIPVPHSVGDQAI